MAAYVRCIEPDRFAVLSKAYCREQLDAKADNIAALTARIHHVFIFLIFPIVESHF
jgi:hypothetical protein